MRQKWNDNMGAKLKKQAGFTLVELLIVVAILAILAAVAIPAYNASMENARETTDRTNAMNATSMASSDYMLNNYRGEVTYTFGVSDQGNIGITNAANATGANNTINSGSYITGTTTALEGQSAVVGTVGLTVTVEDGQVTANSWLALLP